MKGPRDIILVILVAVLALGLCFSGRVILANAGPLTGYQRLEWILGLTASITGIAVIGWWTVALTLAFVSEMLSRAGRHRAALAAGALSPQFMKRLAAAVLGLQLVAGYPVPATAQPAGSAGQTHYAAARTSTTSGLPGIPRALTQPSENSQTIEPQWKPVPGPVAGGPLLRGDIRQSETKPSPATTAVIEVGPGDSLWTIAARHLGPFATEVEIAEAWPRWHHENRQLIGENPHLLLPGQLLRAPQEHR